MQPLSFTIAFLLNAFYETLHDTFYRPDDNAFHCHFPVDLARKTLKSISGSNNKTFYAPD